MVRHKSAQKRARQSIRRHARNKAYQSKLKTLVKRVRSSSDKEKAAAALRVAAKTLDQLAAKGVIHRNKAANQKSELTKFVNAMK